MHMHEFVKSGEVTCQANSCMVHQRLQSISPTKDKDAVPGRREYSQAAILEYFTLQA